MENKGSVATENPPFSAHYLEIRPEGYDLWTSWWEMLWKAEAIEWGIFRTRAICFLVIMQGCQYEEKSH